MHLVSGDDSEELSCYEMLCHLLKGGVKLQMLICSSCLVLHFTINTSLNCCHPLSKLITFSLILFRLFLFSQPLVTERQSKCVFPPLSPQRDWVFSNGVRCFYLLITRDAGKWESSLSLGKFSSRSGRFSSCATPNMQQFEDKKLFL